MPFIGTASVDTALDYIAANGARLDITSAEAANYDQATSALSLGTATAASANVGDGAVDGRRVALAFKGMVHTAGSAGFWALTDGNGQFISAGPMPSTYIVYEGNGFSVNVTVAIREAKIVVTIGEPEPVDGLNPQWEQIPDTKLESVAFDWSSQGGKPGFTNVYAYSGAAFDTTRNRLLIHGGGHGDYGGQEIYALDISTFTWSMVAAPENKSDLLETVCTLPGDANYGRRTANNMPKSVHTYDRLVYVEQLDSLLDARESVAYIECNGPSREAALWSFTNNEWTWWANGQPVEGDLAYPTPYSFGGGAGACAAVHPITKVVYFVPTVGGARITRWNPTTNAWVQGRQDFLVDNSLNKVAVIDTNRNTLIIGRSRANGSSMAFHIIPLADWEADTTRPQDYLVTTTGDTAFLSVDGGRRITMDYDPVGDQLVAWAGGSDIHILDLDTLVWTRHEVPGAIPGAASAAGTYGRFRYIPSIDKFLLTRSVSEDVFLLNLRVEEIDPGEIQNPFVFEPLGAPAPVDEGTKPFADIYKPLNQEHILCFRDWKPTIGSAYDRASFRTVWRSNTVNFEFYYRRANPNLNRPLDTGGYTLYIDGVAHTTSNPITEGQIIGSFTVDVTALTDGWHMCDMSEPGDACSLPWPVFVFRGSVLPPQEWVPVVPGSFHIYNYTHYSVVWVPARNHPYPSWPTPIREFPHFSTLPRTSQSIFVEMLTGASSGHVQRLNKDKDGVLSTATRQDYFWDDLVGAGATVLEVVEGARGVNVLSMVTHISMGTGRLEDSPSSPLLNNIYATDPWRFVRITPDGSVRTLVGHHHEGIPPYWRDDEPSRRENWKLVGDWSAIPESRRNFWDPWGMAWYPFTVEVDNDADPIPAEFNRRPHLRNPVAFIADSRNDRIVRVEFNANSHNVEPVVTEFIRVVGMDPWDCVAWGNKLIVAERGIHQIGQYNMQTGERERTILQSDRFVNDGVSLAWTTPFRFVQTSGTLDERRAEDVVHPEGLYIIPGEDWLYFGSLAQQQIRRVHLVTGELEVVVSGVGNDVNAKYLKIAVSDGTTGPYGTVFYTSWQVGGARYKAPGDVDRPLLSSHSSDLARGRGAFTSTTFGFAGSSYGSAIACGNGRIVFGDATEGLRQISWALPSDPTINRTQYNAGRVKWRNLGYGLKYGGHGQNHFGLALPWGEDADIDYFLTVLGHNPPE